MVKRNGGAHLFVPLRTSTVQKGSIISEVICCLENGAVHNTFILSAELSTAVLIYWLAIWSYQLSHATIRFA